MKRSAMRGKTAQADRAFPDFAALHPGYAGWPCGGLLPPSQYCPLLETPAYLQVISKGIFHMSSKDFKAWLDKMPGKNNTLHVTGSVEVPTSGWTGSLVERVPPGINPSILILDVRLVKPTGTVSDVISFVSLHFQKQHAEQYRQVTIIGAGEDFTIPVSETN